MQRAWRAQSGWGWGSLGTSIASALPDDTSQTFRGLPFVVLRAYRARGLDTAFVVATLARRVNQEDSPKEERLVLVVDVMGEDARRWSVAWKERAAGREEELVVAEPLFAYRTATSRETPGSRSLGLSTKVLPQAIATGCIHIGTMIGKLNGVIPAMTPTGWRSE